MAKATTLYSPDGRKYQTSDRVEITRLKAHGYTEKPPKTASAPSKSTSGSSSSS